MASGTGTQTAVGAIIVRSTDSVFAWADRFELEYFDPQQLRG
jgi:hypothetical protein